MPCSEQQRIDNMEEKLKTLMTIVRGNGDPSKGLTAQVSRLTEWMKQTKWVIGICSVAAVSVIASNLKASNASSSNVKIEKSIEQINKVLLKLAETHIGGDGGYE